MLCVPWTRRVCSVWLQRAAEPTTDQDCVTLSSTPKSLTDILTGHAADRSQARTWGAVSSVQTGPPETQYMQPTGYQQKRQSRAQRARQTAFPPLPRQAPASGAKVLHTNIHFNAKVRSCRSASKGQIIYRDRAESATCTLPTAVTGAAGRKGAAQMGPPHSRTALALDIKSSAPSLHRERTTHGKAISSMKVAQRATKPRASLAPRDLTIRHHRQHLRVG